VTSRTLTNVFAVVLAALALLFILSLAGCATDPNKLPSLPKEVTKIVEEYRPLPGWATTPLPLPEAADNTVGARIKSNDARGNVIRLANCHRALLAKLDAGQSVDPKSCDAMP
jgi:hypothetical protein